MIPRFRAWIKEEKCFADYIETIRYYAKEIDLCWGGICESDCFDFEDVIFTQSTGLRDKNGKEIFEGDILKNNKYITSVFYENGAYCVKFRRTPNTTVIMNVISFIEKYKTEIIGNIWEDGDLIDSKKTREN